MTSWIACSTINSLLTHSLTNMQVFVTSSNLDILADSLEAQLVSVAFWSHILISSTALSTREHACWISSTQ